MKTLRMYKMPFKSNLFNENQKVWIIYRSGCSADRVVGKYRGKGRYIKGWVNYFNDCKEPPKRIIDVEVTDQFNLKIMIKAWGKKHPMIKELKAEMKGIKNESI